MKVLLDHCVDIRFRHQIKGHEILHTKDLGWENLNNGKLLSAAESERFEVFITVDKNLRHQQNLSVRGIAVITLATRFTALDDIIPLTPKVQRLLDGNTPPGDYIVSD